MKSVWKHIDLNGDGELSRPELANALKDSLSQQRLSRLICHHQSEWGVDYEALKSEVEVLLDEGINKEEDEEKKQKLTEKKNKTLASLETKVKSFNFWAEVREPGAAVAPVAPPPPGQTSLSARIANMDSPIMGNLYPSMQQPVSTSESTAITYEPAYVPMPNHPKFWHFHPMAFVEQMRRSVVCSCYRDLTVEEVKEIIKELRDSENATKNNYELFSIASDIASSDKTYEKFTELLNLTFKKFQINTCIRRIHFLAQAYHETNRFRSSREQGGEDYLTGKDYYPFYGRGLMQLTWKGDPGSGHTGYKQYFDYLNRTDYLTKYDEVNSDINLVFDSAGWFWERGKTLSSNNPGKWVAPTFNGTVGSAVAIEGASAEKAIVTYGTNETKYGVLNLNLLADNDWGDTISWLVNGGGNGFQERRNYVEKLKEILGYAKCVNNM